MDTQAIRDAILLATLPNVPFDGWTDHALRNGARAAGYDPATAERAFPRGVPELFEHFSSWADRGMEDALERRELSTLTLRGRLVLALRLRLELLAPYREAVRHGAAYAALPLNAPRAARLVYRTVDTVWFAIGDRSTDFNYYTKRGLLSAVVVAAQLYWLADQSEEFHNTWDFIDRRIATLTEAGRAVTKLTTLAPCVEHFPSASRFARQLRRRFAHQG